MFGNILIDGFKMYANIDEETYYSIKGQIEETLEKHFFKNAYSNSYMYNKLFVSFNPTRYYRDEKLEDDYNLDMPPEEELYNLFNEMGFYSMSERLADRFIVSLIHLCKNIPTENEIIDYIKYLRGRTFKKMFKPLDIKSGCNNDTLVLASPDRRNDIKPKDRRYVFYNKGRELKDKKNRISLKIQLKYPLTEEEKNMIPPTAFNEAGTVLNLDKLNILRFEQQYQRKAKLEPLAKFLQGEDCNEGLKLTTILKLLEKRELYKKLLAPSAWVRL